MIKKVSGTRFLQHTEFVVTLTKALSPTYPDFSDWLQKRVKDTNTTFYIATQKDTVIGVAIIKDESDISCKLSTLYVSEDYRGRGVGHALMEECEEHWATNGDYYIYVTTRRESLIPFFNRYGFNLIDVRPVDNSHDLDFLLKKIMD